MEIRVLGPVEVRRAGEPLYLARRQQRLLLGILALEPNRLVPVERLIEFLWSDRPPQQARAILQTRTSELRSALRAYEQTDSVKVRTRGAGYLLEVQPDVVDAHRFRKIVEQSRKTTEPQAACSLLREALSLWRGPVLGGHLDDAARSVLCGGLEAERLTAAEGLYDLELNLGRHQHVADEVSKLAHASPSRERLTGLMMRALHGAGRTAEALYEYDQWRRWLADELGIDPSSEIQRLHLAILQADPALASTGESYASVEPAGFSPIEVMRDGTQSELADTELFEASRPQILPPDIQDFTGRTTTINALSEELTKASGARCSIVAISGAGGIGKTALSVRLAHTLRAHYPDGQLYVNLRGADPARPVEPGEALSRFLRALGVDGSAIPHNLEERSDLYRDLLAERQVLVVLDNAASDEQILPLIPSGPRSAVIVNGRARLGTALGARISSLAVLGLDDSLQLISRIVGEQRVAAELAAAEDLCRLCGFLPLAMRVAAAKLASKPHWQVSKLVSMLADERRRLDHLKMGNLDVRSTISLSYKGLAPAVRRLLDGLGDLSFPHINVWLSAAVADTGLDEAEEMLEHLFDAQLIDVLDQDGASYSRYQMHDLVQLFAKERAHVAGDQAELRAMRSRAYAAWLLIADAAHREMDGGNYYRIQGQARRWKFDDAVVHHIIADTIRWFETERRAIVAAVRRGADDTEAAFCWELVNATSATFETCRSFDDWQEVLEIALDATRTAGDVRGEAAVQFWWGSLHSDRTEYGRSKEALSTAVDLFQRCEDRLGYAMAMAYLGMVERFEGNVEVALNLYQHALPILQETCERSGEALVLRNLAQIWLQQGDHDLADSHLRRALDIYEALGSRRTHAAALFWNGMLRLDQGRYVEGEQEFMRALSICRFIGDRGGEAQCLHGLGISARRQGEPSKALSLLSQALRMVQQPKPTFLAATIQRTINQIRNGNLELPLRGSA